MKAISFDIETLDSAPTAAIVALGAVEFDDDRVHESEGYYATVSPSDAMKFGTVDGKTLQWWFQQSEPARMEIALAKGSLRDAITGLLRWSQERAKEVWSKPSSFDLPILDYACRAQKLQLPWHYKTWRDMRTLWALAGFPRPEVRAIIDHHALADAIEQAHQIRACMKLITRSPP